MEPTSLLEIQQLAFSATLMVVGAVGVYRRRRTVASLYLDARVWYNRTFGPPRRVKNDDDDDRVARLRDLPAASSSSSSSSSADTFAVVHQVDEPTGLTVHVWTHVDDGKMRAVGEDAPYPSSEYEATLFARVACPFVLLTYINSRQEEYTLEVDDRLWYRRYPTKLRLGVAPERRQWVGLPKFTRDEVYYLLGRAHPTNGDLVRAWTDEYTLECTTADGRDVCLRHDQVFWTAAAPVPDEEAAVNDAAAAAAAPASSSATEEAATLSAAPPHAPPHAPPPDADADADADADVAPDDALKVPEQHAEDGCSAAVEEEEEEALPPNKRQCLRGNVDVDNVDDEDAVDDIVYDIVYDNVDDEDTVDDIVYDEDTVDDIVDDE